jgi:hypothetical protein
VESSPLSMAGGRRVDAFLKTYNRVFIYVALAVARVGIPHSMVTQRSLDWGHHSHHHHALSVLVHVAKTHVAIVSFFKKKKKKKKESRRSDRSVLPRVRARAVELSLEVIYVHTVRACRAQLRGDTCGVATRCSD